MMTLTAQAVGTFIGVTLILIIVLPIVLGICICVCICVMCRRQSTIIVNQAAQPGTGVPRGTRQSTITVNQAAQPAAGVPLGTRQSTSIVNQAAHTAAGVPRGMQECPEGEICTAKHVMFNRGPRGNVGIQCKKFGLGAMIVGLIPDEPAFNCGKLTVGDVIESVDGQSLASMSEVEMRGYPFKGQPGSMITLYIDTLYRGASSDSSSADRIATLPQARASNDKKPSQNSTCSVAGAGLTAGSVSLTPDLSLSVSSQPDQCFIKLPIPFDKTRPTPIDMKTRDTRRHVLLGLYFQLMSDPGWMKDVLAEYDLSNDMEDLISNGVRKGSDLRFLMHEPSVLKDLSMTPIAKARLRNLLKDLSEICNENPEEDAGMAATLDDVELDPDHVCDD
jgi:hypothetical protein